MSDNDLRYSLYCFLRYYFGKAYFNYNSAYAPYVWQNFWLYFCKHSSLTLTEEKLNNFKTKIMRLIDMVKETFEPTYPTDKSRPLSEIIANETTNTLLQSAFAEIGILSVGSGSSQYTFTMPDNTIMTLYDSELGLIFKSCQEYNYTKNVCPYATFQILDMENIENIKTKNGLQSWWEYDTNGILTVKGTGATLGANVLRTDSDYISNIANLNTMIIESTISGMGATSALANNDTRTGSTFAIRNFVFEHSNSDTITLDTLWFPAPKSASDPKPVFNIYTDNDTVKNFSYSSNITVNFHSLSEWEE